MRGGAVHAEVQSAQPEEAGQFNQCGFTGKVINGCGACLYQFGGPYPFVFSPYDNSGNVKFLPYIDRR